MKKVIKYFWCLLALIFFVVLIVLALLNMQQVSLNYFWGNLELPLIALMVLAFCLGAVVGGILTLLRSRRPNK